MPGLFVGLLFINRSTCLPTPPDDGPPAPTGAASPFRHTSVRFSPSGGTTVSWLLHRWFSDPGPHSFLLQQSRDPGPAGEWADVGFAVTDVETLVDEEKRVWGRRSDVWYRVVLATSAGVYPSPAIQAGNLLNFREWRLSREILRKEQLRHRRYASAPCVYLRRKRYGARCKRCAHAATGEATTDRCSRCWGTGVDGGYLAPMRDVWVTFGLTARREQTDDQTVGTTSPEVIDTCRIVGDPRPDSYDVIVDLKGGRRFYVHKVTNQAEVSGYTIVSEMELRPAEYSDPIYDFPIDEALPGAARLHEQSPHYRNPDRHAGVVYRPAP